MNTVSSHNYMALAGPNHGSCHELKARASLDQLVLYHTRVNYHRCYTRVSSQRFGRAPDTDFANLAVIWRFRIDGNEQVPLNSYFISEP